jgi:hypothetical protein
MGRQIADSVATRAGFDAEPGFRLRRPSEGAVSRSSKSFTLARALLRILSGPYETRFGVT